MTTNGMHVPAAVQPTADPCNQWNVWEGSQVRFGRKPPQPVWTHWPSGPGLQTSVPTPKTDIDFAGTVPNMRGLATFVKRYVKKHYVPLIAGEYTFEWWLAQCNYPLWRKDQLETTWKELDSAGGIWSDDRLFTCKSFMKFESYLEFKYPRAINSRSDAFKCFSGPLFKAIEKEVFKQDEFIKKVPVADRPKHIMARLYADGARYMATDYTAFEALFTEDLMKICEFHLYYYMTKDLPGGPEWRDVVVTALSGPNVCKFKDFTVKVPGTRMSGEMCTSLGNSFTNLMVALYVLECCGTPHALGVVEGDDGLFRVVGRWPTESDFANLGLIIKIERHNTLSEASFCGLVFDPDDLSNVTDPRDLMTAFGWVDGKYASASSKTLRMLLKSKSLSYLYQYPGCPIVQEMALMGLRCTKDISSVKALQKSMKAANQYEVDMYADMIKHLPTAKPVGLKTRLLVERKYGISVQQQLDAEAYCQSINAVQPLEFSMIDFPASWQTYASRYVRLSEGNAGHALFLEWPEVRDQTVPAPQEPPKKGKRGTVR